MKKNINKGLLYFFETKITFKDYIDGFITAKLGAPFRINNDRNPENKI